MKPDDQPETPLHPSQSPWAALETIPGSVGLPADWLLRAGEQFAALRALCLQATEWLGQSFPCPRNCGCVHSVIMRHDRTAAVAACKCDPPDCPDIPLTLEDITPLELSWARLARALSKAFGFSPRFTKLTPPNTFQLGVYSPALLPAILTIHTFPAALRAVIAELVAIPHKPFILFAPTANTFDAPCQAMLESCGAAFFPLADTVTLTPGGVLTPTRPPADLFASFAPQPKEIDENLAVRAFALVKALDAEAGKKLPSPTTVFVHYCIDALTVTEIAKRCHCSRATILNRLALIRRRTGADPAHLRTLSGHLARLENAITDPRASRIHRARLADDVDDADPT